MAAAAYPIKITAVLAVGFVLPAHWLFFDSSWLGWRTFGAWDCLEFAVMGCAISLFGIPAIFTSATFVVHATLAVFGWSDSFEAFWISSGVTHLNEPLGGRTIYTGLPLSIYYDRIDTDPAMLVDRGCVLGVC